MELIIILFCVCMLVSALGWHTFLYFISLGYGYSIAACAVTIVVCCFSSLTPASWLLTLVLFLYGMRLGTFLLLREQRSASYKAKLPSYTQTSFPITIPIKVAVWISVSLLYVMQVSPVALRCVSGKEDNVFAYLGVAVMILALAGESLADQQKSRSKKENPNRFCDKGLYRIVRCPNYFCEMLFWTGCLLSGIGVLSTWWHWTLAVVGYVCIVYIMFGGARRLEVRQNKAYGVDPDYQAYVRNTPIILPFVPLYSVERFTWLKG